MKEKQPRGGKRKGAGRPVQPPTKVITFRVNLDHEQPVRDAVKKIVQNLKTTTMKILLTIIAICSLASCATISKNVESNYQAKSSKPSRTVRQWYFKDTCGVITLVKHHK